MPFAPKRKIEIRTGTSKEEEDLRSRATLWSLSEADCGNDEEDVGRFSSLNLPSFSGPLNVNTDGENRSPLLRYDLVLGPAKNIRLRPPMPCLLPAESSSTMDLKLKKILGGAVGLFPCIQVDGVRVVAFQPEILT